jgi:hypothetical protein
MNEGLRGFAPGVFQTVRNPTTHGTEDLPEQEALDVTTTDVVDVRRVGLIEGGTSGRSGGV